MAELILTDEEKAAASWLDLDDASLGRLVKYGALIIEGDGDGEKKLRGMTAAIFLASMCHQANADTTKLSLSGVTSTEGESIGDWTITVKRKAGTP